MNFSRALVTLRGMADSIIAGLPNFILALAIFLLFYFVARRTRFFVVRLTDKQHKARNLGIILGKLAQSAVILLGLLVVLSILFPSFNPGDLIQLLGIGSVAIGFAFHDLFQNFLAGVLLLVTWMSLVHVVRAEFLRARNLDYVRAARALGLRNRAIMFRHILPNAMVAALTFLPFILSPSITLLTALDFLGFGLPRGSASIGELLNQVKNNLVAPWLGIAGFAVMAVMLSLLIFIGEASRDAFDPRKST